MQIISQKITGYFIITGLFLILALNLFLSQSFLVNLGLIILLFLTAIFLYQPKWGFFLILFIRPLIDKLDFFSLSSNILRETIIQWYIWSLIGTSLALKTLNKKE